MMVHTLGTANRSHTTTHFTRASLGLVDVKPRKQKISQPTVRLEIILARAHLTHLTPDVSYCHNCQGFNIVMLSVLHTVPAFNVSYCHGCKCFMLSWLTVFHTVIAVSVHTAIWVPGFHTVIAVRVSYCHGCQCFILSCGCQDFILSLAVKVSYCHCFQCFILSWVSVFHTVMGVSI